METKIYEIQFGQGLWERLKDIGYLLLVIALLFLLTPDADAAVTSFSYNDSHVIYLGVWTLVTTGSPFYYLQGPQSEVRFSATGTKLEVWSLLGCTAIIDGGSPVTLAAGQQTAFTGLSDTSHSVRLTGCSEVNADALQAFRVTGAAPALTITTGLSQPIILTTTAFTDWGKLDGVDTSDTTILGVPGISMWSGDGSTRFRSDATDIYFWGYGLSGFNSTVAPFVVVQDGIDIGTFTPSGSGVLELQHFKSGLSGAHEYEIKNIGLINGTTLRYWLYQVMLPGGTGNGLLHTVETPRSTAMAYGDSIVAAITNTIDARHAEWYLTGNSAGYTSQRYGVPGTEVSGPTTPYLRDNTSFVTNPRPQFNVIINEGGVNDCIFGATTFQADYLTMLQNEQAGLPASTFILNRGILPYANFGGSVVTFRGYQQAATAAYNATLPATPACYFDTAGWINPTSGVDTVDGLHLNNGGSLKTSNRMAPIVIGKLSGASYTVTGPEHGLISTASTNFTVSMIGATTFTGDQTITITDSDTGTTFTPSVGGPATHNVTVAPTNGASSFTFTITPVTYGQHTLTFTNAQDCWTNPQVLKYTVGTAFLVGEL